MRRRLLFPAWCAALVLALVALHLLGDTELALPLQPGLWPAHVERVGPAAAVVGVLRLIAMALAWYLVAVTVVGAATRAARVERGVSVADAVTPRFLRRLLASAGGLAISGAGLALATAPIAVGVDSAGSASDPSSRPQAEATFRRLSPVLVRLPVAQAEADSAEAQSADADSAQASTAESSLLDLSGLGGALAAAGERSVDETWTVDCGDHLWLIAEEVLAEVTGSVPDDDTVTGYWLTLIAANRDRLVAPDNPDLLVPGQTLTIPAPPVVS